MRFPPIIKLCKPCFAVTPLLCSAAALADEVTGSDMLVCHGLSGPEHVTSTDARGEAQRTPISTIERANGFIVLEGIDGERSPRAGITVFTVCTSMEKL
jgi:hypothetical protein